jgi:fructose/tagatose bisphosphate aldolase
MPLETIDRLMRSAHEHRYAIGYFESWSLESLLGVVDAAEATRSPVIIGFNGEFLSQHPGATKEDLATYGRIGRTVAEEAKVPCGFIFNECSDDSWVERAITAGFNLVMPADPKANLADYTQRVSRLAALAHRSGVAIEAEIDELPSGTEQGAASDPQVAADFVASTNVDLLAVSVGNEHIRLQGRVPLDLDRLKAISRLVTIPLVLHGGSGIEDASLRLAIGLGVRKVNYGTYIKQNYLKAIRGALATPETNPHATLGGGSDTDVMVIGRATVRDAVLERISILGCCGKV